MKQSSQIPAGQDNIIQRVNEYYTRKLDQYGSSPAGVDWNGEQGQLLRFEQLAKLLPQHAGVHYSLADVGCGYAALYDYLAERPDFDYYGYDVSEAMCEAARDRLANRSNVVITKAGELSKPVDYVVASGIFNVRMDLPDQLWWQYLLGMLDNFNQYGEAGFAFNCLSSYSDRDKRRADLYYADALELFHHCKTNYSRDVALLHDYGLYEFTILVRK